MACFLSSFICVSSSHFFLRVSSSFLISLSFQAFLPFAMSSVNTSALGMGGNDFGGSIGQPMVKREVILIGESLEEVLSPTNHSVSDRGPTTI